MLVSHARQPAEPLALQIDEPRCRVCRDPDVRRRVNALLQWRGVPIFLEGGKTHRITYADILRDLEPINRGRAEGDRISYSSLRIHAKRHYELAGVVAYWSTWMDKQLRDLCGDKRCKPQRNWH